MAASSSVSISSDTFFSFSDGCSLEGIENRDQCLQTIRDRLGMVMAETVKSIAAKTENAKENYPNDNKLLNTAIWYPNDYVRALNETKQTERLDFLGKNNHITHGFVSKNEFEPYMRDGKRQQWEFLVRDKILPSEALKKAFEGVSILDCGSVCQLARYNALRVVLGDERFNKLFNKATGEAMNTGFKDHEAQPMRYFCNFTRAATTGDSGTIGNRPVKVGHVVSFNNSFKYQFKHPFGMGSNYNLVCVDATPGKQRFCGHGTPPEGFTEEQLIELFVREFNEESGSSFKLTITKEEVPGYASDSPQGFNLALIHDLVARKLEGISIAFVREHPQAIASAGEGKRGEGAFSQFRKRD